MGTFGTGPYQSDAAGDWLNAAFIPPIERAIRGRDHEKARVAAATIVDFLSKHENDPGLVEQAIERLEEILVDEDWIDAWNDPKDAARAVRTQIRKLEKIATD